MSIVTQRIIEIFCDKRGIPLSELDNPKRKSRVWSTRYMIWFYLHCDKGMSVGKIARIFGRNRPSVFRGIRIIKHHMELYKDVRDEYNFIVKELEGMTEATPSENMEE